MAERMSGVERFVTGKMHRMWRKWFYALRSEQIMFFENVMQRDYIPEANKIKNYIIWRIVNRLKLPKDLYEAIEKVLGKNHPLRRRLRFFVDEPMW